MTSENKPAPPTASDDVIVRACPTCPRQVKSPEPTFPFCSKRCKLLDLARWAQGEYRISRPIDDSDFNET